MARTIDVGDHTLFIAEASGCDYCDNVPLVFFSSRYHLGPGARPSIADRTRLSDAGMLQRICRMP